MSDTALLSRRLRSSSFCRRACVVLVASKKATLLILWGILVFLIELCGVVVMLRMDTSHPITPTASNTPTNHTPNPQPFHQQHKPKEAHRGSSSAAEPSHS